MFFVDLPPFIHYDVDIEVHVAACVCQAGVYVQRVISVILITESDIVLNYTTINQEYVSL